MRVVFLDFDGVLNDGVGPDRAPRFQEQYLARLQRILSVGRAVVVVISGWRRALSLVELAGHLRRAGLRINVVDAVGWKPGADGTDGRRDQTRRWLLSHTGVTSWVVLDDSRAEWREPPRSVWEPSVPAWAANRLVQPINGLSEADVARALAVLGPVPR